MSRDFKQLNIVPFLVVIELFSGCINLTGNKNIANKSINQEKMQLVPEITFVPEGGSQSNITLYKNIPFVEVYINGSGPFLFCIDTGTTSLLLSNELIQKLRLKQSSRNTEVILHTSAGTTNLGRPYEVENVSIGQATFNRLEAAQIQSGVLSKWGTKIDGVLGLGIFKNCELQIDYINQKLNINNIKHLLPPEPKDRIPAVVNDRGDIFIEGKIADNIFTFQLDTGNAFGINISRQYQGDIKLKDAPVKLTVVSFVKMYEVLSGTLDGDATFGNIVVQNPPIYIETQNLIGSEFFKDCILRINQKEKYISIQH